MRQRPAPPFSAPRGVLLLLTVLGFARCAGDSPGASVPAAAVEGALASVMRVVTVRGSGTAFTAAGAEVVTAAHIVDGLVRVHVMDTDGSLSEARVVGLDRSRDIAILDAAGTRPTLAWGDVQGLRDGDPVALLGFPEGATAEPVVVHTRLSRIHEAAGVSVIDLDAEPRLGFSGGPVIDEHGQVVGVVSQRTPSGDGVRAIAAPAARAGLAAAANQPPPSAEGVAASLDQWFERLVGLFTTAGRELERVSAGETSPAVAGARLREWAREALALADEVAAARPAIAEVNVVCECGCVEFANAARLLALLLTDAAGWIGQDGGTAVATAVLGGAIADMEEVSLLVALCTAEAGAVD